MTKNTSGFGRQTETQVCLWTKFRQIFTILIGMEADISSILMKGGMRLTGKKNPLLLLKLSHYFYHSRLNVTQKGERNEKSF